MLALRTRTSRPRLPQGLSVGRQQALNHTAGGKHGHHYLLRWGAAVAVPQLWCGAAVKVALGRNPAAVMHAAAMRLPLRRRFVWMHQGCARDRACVDLLKTTARKRTT
ncbi:hypothetical protein VaNZ11_013516 [Volvox africanus]|uniref:Uncharacterized protein n=1 Tax=Volvox africanus TaxID=51714 RepID=A0ABQ5SH82_9CHLO|nr:hypothetical protein VaNZ11_013516 [Volvox africanus]